jgi:hypothetical protein
MTRRRAPWNLKRRISAIRKWLDYTEFSVENLEQEIKKDDTSPQSVSFPLASFIGKWNWFSGTYDVLSERSEGWTKILLALRCEAVDTKVYLDRIDQLVASDPRGASNRRLPIGRLGGTDILLASLSVLSAIVLGEHQFADWCGRRLIKSFVEPDYVCDPKSWEMWRENPAFLLLFAKWRRIDLLPLPRGLSLASPYTEIFAGWDDDSRFFPAVEELCRYHESHCTGNEDPFFHPYEVFPAEILALQRIRGELGLSFPEKLDFAIMQTPLARVPISIPRLPNEYISRVIRKCQSMMPLEVPWEVELG